MDRGVRGSKVHQREQKRQPRDVHMADFLRAIDEVAEMGHGGIESAGLGVEADLHHLLDELNLCESTALLVAATQENKGFLRGDATVDVLRL